MLNDDLAHDFRRWHPGFTHTTNREPLAGSLPQFFPLSYLCRQAHWRPWRRHLPLVRHGPRVDADDEGMGGHV